jgi:hypothetical protein
MPSGGGVSILGVMAHAFGSEDARRELHELRVDEWTDFLLAGAALGLSLGATQVAPAFALPFFFGGVVVLGLAVRAVYRRWDLCERLLLDPGAYDIAEVHDRAEGLASLAQRRRLAFTIRALVAEHGTYRSARVQPIASELAELADELSDESLVLEPICAVRCRRLVTEPTESPLLNPELPADSLRIAVARIRAGFEPRT